MIVRVMSNDNDDDDGNDDDDDDNQTPFVFHFHITYVIFHIYRQGLVSYAEFRRVFQESEEEIETRISASGSGGSVIESIPSKSIPEIAEGLKEVGNKVNQLVMC